MFIKGAFPIRTFPRIQKKEIRGHLSKNERQSTSKLADASGFQSQRYITI